MNYQKKIYFDRSKKRTAPKEYISPSFKGLVEVVIKVEGRKEFSIFCKPKDVEKKRAQTIERYSRPEKITGKLIL